jgi:hypothetical protein
VYDRADKCGHLPARECNDCGTTFSEGTNHRYNCRARLHPLCMGTQARKPLWNAQDRLEAEAGLQISITQLGVYDIGEDHLGIVYFMRINLAIELTAKLQPLFKYIIPRN